MADWLSLVPSRLLHLPAELGRGQRLDAVVVLVDVCGFTAMSEVVAQAGPAGTELLSRTVNEVFTPIVDLVHAHEGEVALFIGDAVLAVFTTASGALACAAAVHERIEGATAFDLALAVGLAAGPLTSTVVGDPAVRLEHVLIGDVLRRAAQAQRLAGPGRTAGARELEGFADGPMPATARPAREQIAPFVHPSVAARIDAGRDELLAEHRRVTSLFCHFEDLDEADPEAPARLQRVVRGALETLERFGGALAQVELVDKGSTLKATFGAPLAHEDDERRATACARALLARPELETAAIGLSTGTVLCGLIGSPSRREYTVLGDAVNVAARLMLAARPGQILATEATCERAGPDWGWQPVGPLALRGRASEVAAYEPTRVGGAKAQPARTCTLIGRERELEHALGRLERAAAGTGSRLTITGEAGAGKSTLLDALAADARVRGVTVIRGEADPLARDYGAWRTVLGTETLDSLTPELDTPELRADALQALVVERLRRHQPLLLAFEDCQWLDEPSRDLLERVARELAPLRVLLVTTDRTGHGELALAGLASEQLARIVRAYRADLPEDVVAAIVARSGGNPLFAEELASFQGEREGPLPHTLRAVVTARLDTLAQPERNTLRVAAVIGQRFDPEWISALQPDGSLAALARSGLIHAEGAFRHGLIREVAYETLALTAREHLHGEVARYVERTHDVETVLDLLAHHYGHSTDTAKQRVYFRRAGDAARAGFATATAIRHYRALLDLVDGAEALDARLDLGGMLEFGGEWAQAEALYTRAARDGAGAVAARAEAALGNLLALTGSYPAAIAQLEQARKRFAALADRTGEARALERLAHTYFQQGNDEKATIRADQHRRLARQLGDRAGESTALETLALVLWHRGELEPARERLEAALALAREAGHRVGVVHALNDLAGVLVALDRPGEAIERLGEAYAEALDIGYRRFAGVVVGNAAELFQLAGNDAAALACAERALDTAAALGDLIAVLHSATVIAAVRRRQGDPRGALRVLSAVTATARASDNRRYLAEARLHEARALRDLGQPAGAAAAEALAVARAIGQADLIAAAEALDNDAPPPTVLLDGHEAFLDGARPATDGATLARRAQAVLDALNTSNDVVRTAGRP